MKETVGLHSSFEDVYANKKAFPDVYNRVSELVQFSSEPSPLEQPVVAARIEVKSPLEQIRESWQKEAHTPDLITRVSRRIFELTKDDIAIPFTMPTEFPADARRITEHEVKGERAIFQPIELSTPEGRVHLAQAFRKLGNLYVPEHWSTQKGNNVVNIKPHSGWRWISGEIDAPNLDTSADKAKKTLLKNGYEGIDENEYLILGLHMKTTEDACPDQDRTWTWLLNSSRDGRLVHAGFHRYGSLVVDSYLNGQNHDPNLGVRLSSGVENL